MHYTSRYILLLLLATFILLPIKSISQTIELDMPSCHALQYTLALNYGAKMDTILTGRLDTVGKARFTLPEKYSTYRGVATLSIPFGKQNVNIILAGEDRIVVNEVPDADNWTFSVSDENKYLLDMLAKQTKIIEEYNQLVNSLKPNELTFSLTNQKIVAKNNEYKSLVKEISQSPLYAARILEILRCLSGMGSSLNLSLEEIVEEQKEFYTEDLKIKDLYSSGFWQLAMNLFYQNFSTDNTLLLQTTKVLLDKTEEVPLRRELTQSIIQLFSKYGQDNLLVELGSEYLTIPLNGKPAPELITDGAPIQPKSCLIFFYDSDCGLCHYEMRALMDKYELLSNDHNQIEVISIAADTDRAVFEDTGKKFPWRLNLFDGKGFEGINFENYGIVGTPTFVLVDKEGIIRGRYMKLEEFLK